MNNQDHTSIFHREYSKDFLLPLALRAGELTVNQSAWDALNLAPVGPIMINHEDLRRAVKKQVDRGSIDQNKISSFAEAATRDGDQFGWVAQNGSTRSIAVTLRGTSGLDEWLKDVFILPVPFPYSDALCGVHAGFLIVYESIRRSLGDLIKSIAAQQHDLIITGHSLGAAVASIAALDLKKEIASDLSIDVQSFASPRPSDILFAKELRTSGISVLTHWNAPNDVVPGVPVFPFFHPDTVVVLDGNHSGDIPAAHNLEESYRPGLQRLKSDDSDLGKFPDYPYIYSETNIIVGDSLTSASRPTAAKRAANVQVATIYARPYWNTDPPIFVEEGQTYDLVAEGTWVDDGQPPCDASGYSSGDNTLLKSCEWMRRVRDANWFALVGAFDSNESTAFVIGKRSRLKAVTGGRLTCFANDVPFMYFNNKGKIDLIVTRVEEL